MTEREKKNCDILLLTIDAVLELPALLGIFEIDFENDIFDINHNINYWEISVSTKYKGNLSIVIVALIEQGNPNAGAKTMQFLKYFSPNIAILIGTAAGVKKLNLGDVVICDKIHYYESKRMEEDGEKPKPKEKNIDTDILTNLSLFLGNIYSSRLQWYTEYDKYILSFDSILLPTLINQTKPNIKIGHIACGEKLFVDGSLQKFHEEIDNKIIAGETEAFGFASACENEKIPWIVIRGISDYGEPKSKDGMEKDKFHIPSVAAACAFSKFFIENGLKVNLTSKKKNITNDLKLIETLFPLKIETVLVSTGDKTNLDILIPFLVKNNIEIITTFGSVGIIKNYTNKFKTINEYVGCESIAGTRGTLHPYILAAIKVGTNDKDDIEKLKKYHINKIDIVFVNAKPNKLPGLNQPNKILEYISDMQVGAPALLRWVIRQHKNCISVTSTEDYIELIDLLEYNSMIVSPEMRLFFLRKSLQYLSERDKETQLFLDKIWSRDF